MSGPGPLPPAARHTYLDSLRGIAIGGVVLTHVGLAVPGLPPAVAAFATFGFRGVQLFFMVSALTLCLVSKPGPMDYEAFYGRRFFRIAPMFHLAGLAYLGLNLAGVMDFAPAPITATDVAATALFLHGLVPHAINAVVPGGWSIASEVIFYALFPWLLRHVTTTRRAILLLAGALVLALAFQGIGRVLPANRPDASTMALFLHFGFPSNLPAFACGLLLFRMLRGASPAWPYGKRAGEVAAVALLAALAGFGALSWRIPLAQFGILPLLAATVALAARASPVLLVNPVLVVLGEISFSLYLVHFAVLHVIEAVVPMPAAPVLHLAVLFGAVLVASAGVALVTYHAVERPGIALGRRLTRRPREATQPFDGHRDGEVPLPSPGGPPPASRPTA